jgi:hypothetical protein
MPLGFEVGFMTRQELFDGDGDPAALFPLTPTLSLGERENWLPLAG